MPSTKPQIVIRLSEQEKTCWEFAARESGVPLAAYVRTVVNHDAGCDDDAAEEEEVVDEPVVSGSASVSVREPERATSSSVIKTVEDAVAVLAERGAAITQAEVKPAPAAPVPGVPRSAKTGLRSKRKVAERGDGRCAAYAPYGTKCKLCGKVHPS